MFIRQRTLVSSAVLHLVRHDRRRRYLGSLMVDCLAKYVRMGPRHRVGDVPISTIREPRPRSVLLLQHNCVVGRRLLILNNYNADGQGRGYLRDSPIDKASLIQPLMRARLPRTLVDRKFLSADRLACLLGRSKPYLHSRRQSA